MKVEILWVEDKVLNIMNFSHQTKTFASEEKALEWCRKNSAHILQINDSRLFYDDIIHHFDIMDALRNK